MTTPAWPHCGEGATTADPVGCTGIHIPGATKCLAHATTGQKTAYLASLSPGSDVDLRGTPIDAGLLRELLDALRDPATGEAHLGRVQFVDAAFGDDAWFGGATFAGATFGDHARFDGATFGDGAWFAGATFGDDAWFGGATFGDRARFGGATFGGDVWFGGATFGDRARFAGLSCAGLLSFEGARLATHALGPLACEELNLSKAVFESAVTISVTAKLVHGEGMLLTHSSTLRVRGAWVDLSGMIFSAPTSVVTEATPFLVPGGGGSSAPLADPAGADADRPIRVTALRGVDAEMLALGDTDLTECRFAGVHHLDRLRLDGRTVFGHPPTTRRWGMPRWSRRQVVAEEQHLRATRTPDPTLPPDQVGPQARGWDRGPHHPDPALTPDPGDVGAVYRQLRKAFEDAKDEPGAADFYYGEMEMRRHDPERSRGERALLAAYWFVSGYGLRAWRALACLGVAMAFTVLALMAWGVPGADPKPVTTAVPVAAGQPAQWVTDTPDPELDLGYHERFTWGRTEKATKVVINSVVFRASPSAVTPVGTYIEMVTRFLTPVLLVLAILAVRGRVKR